MKSIPREKEGAECASSLEHVMLDWSKQLAI